MKPFLPVKTNVDILSGKPLNKVITRHVYRKSASASFSHPFRLLALLIFCCHNLQGTSALAIRTNTFLIVGADSIREGPAGAEHVCKIRQSGSFFVTIGGLVGSVVSPYDPYAIAISAIARCPTIECAVYK